MQLSFYICHKFNGWLGASDSLCSCLCRPNCPLHVFTFRLLRNLVSSRLLFGVVPPEHYYRFLGRFTVHVIVWRYTLLKDAMVVEQLSETIRDNEVYTTWTTWKLVKDLSGHRELFMRCRMTLLSHTHSVCLSPALSLSHSLRLSHFVFQIRG